MPPAPGTTPFRDEPYFQGDGSKFQWENCVLAACTELIGRVTVGRLRIPAPVLRKRTGDKDGGVTYDQAASAVADETDNAIILRPRYGLERSQVRDMAASGRAFCISLDCTVTVGTKRATGTFKGCHTVYVNEYAWRTNGACECERELTAKGHGEFQVEDPGTSRGYRWWSASLLFRAAEARGGGRINTLVGTDTEGVTRFGKMNGRIRETPFTDGPDLGPVVLGQSYSVIATEVGGPWKRADGTVAFGWHRIEHENGTGFLAGERLSR